MSDRQTVSKTKCYKVGFNRQDLIPICLISLSQENPEKEPAIGMENHMIMMYRRYKL
jgi:hypothetical protein